ncbi:MAG: ABC transporter ATP-binding protein [Clostridia bacterium]
MKEVMIKSLKKYKWHIVFFLILIGTNIYLLTYPPKIIGNMIDMLYQIEENRQNITNSIFLLMGVCLVALVVRLIWKYYEGYIVRGFEKEVKDKLFERFLKIKMEKIQNIKNGEIMSYFVQDTNEIRSAFYRILSHGSRIVFTFIIAIFSMAQGVNIYLTMAVIFPIILASYLVVKIRKYVELNFRKAQKNFTAFSEYVQESTDSIRTTKAYVCEQEQLKEFIRKNRRLRSSNNAVDVHSNLLTMCIDICFGLCYAIALIFGSHLVLEGTITIGELVAFNGYIALFVGPVSWLPAVIAKVKRGQISYGRLEKVFALEKEKISVKQAVNKEALKGDIEIKNLSFHYPECIDNVLQNIDLKIKKGQTLGIIGTIGSGKTTLMNLLTKLYNVPNGKILIDGRDINEIPIEVLRSNICYITQDNFLFSTTLKENIGLFKEGYEDKEVEESTKKAIIYDEIQEMDAGIHTVIGERGVDLSGGQKQRLVISRAFLNKSSIVIFDDTFSALDNRTEQKLLTNIKELTKEKTCMIISNRISDVKDTDHIIVLDGGRIVEEGTHEELLEKQGTYYTFYTQQANQKETSKEENFLA